MKQLISIRQTHGSVLLLCIYILLSTCCSPRRIFSGSIRHDILPGRSDTARSPKAVEELIAIDINGVKEWLLIRGHDRSNPIILSVHGGPGFPNMWNIDVAATLLEHDFTVVYWEQRGTMKSWSKHLDCTDLTLKHLTEDVIAVSEWLISTFQQPQIYLRGESFGTVPGLLAAAQRPDLFRAYIANSQVVEFFENETISWQFADSCARANCDLKAERSLSKIHPESPDYNARQNNKLKSYIGKYGGWFYNRDARARASRFKSFRKMMNTPEYAVSDIWHIMNHALFSAKCLESEVRQINFFRQVSQISIPVFFMNGRYDQMTPSRIAYRYYEYIAAPKGKYFIWFEHSAHSPMLEEPYRYYREMLRMHDFLNPATPGLMVK